MAYYQTCPYCGRHNDPGEKCTCASATFDAEATAAMERTGLSQEELIARVFQAMKKEATPAGGNQ